ncbi:MAG: hypothetical protein SNJ82_10320, partial [Gemmataceae bacterium]
AVPSSSPPTPTQKVERLKTLNLSLDEPKSPRSATTASEPREEPPLPSSSRDRSDKPQPRARLLDDHEEMRDCPTCGKMIHREATSCSWCGERFGRSRVQRDRYEDEENEQRYRDYDDRPRYRRRDWEPHRGDTITIMGIFSLVMGLANFGLCICCFPIPIPIVGGPLGIVLGIVGWWMASVDLGKMRRNEMDPAGESSTRSGCICVILGTVVNGLSMLLSCVFLIIVVAAMISDNFAKQNNRDNNVPVFRR